MAEREGGDGRVLPRVDRGSGEVELGARGEPARLLGRRPPGDSLAEPQGTAAQGVGVRARDETCREAVAAVLEEVDHAGVIRDELADLADDQIQHLDEAQRRAERLGDLVERVDLAVRRRDVAQHGTRGSARIGRRAAGLRAAGAVRAGSLPVDGDAAVQQVLEVPGVGRIGRRPDRRHAGLEDPRPGVGHRRLHPGDRPRRGPACRNDNRRQAGAQHGHHLRVVVNARPRLEELAGLFGALARPVDPVRREGLQRVGDGQDPRPVRDRLALQPVRVARAVPAFVVVLDDRQHGVRELDLRQDLGGHARVDLDLLVLDLG